ncbi:pyridoxal phosphate-dependent transferase [Aspergillus novoparasiticus]|uniref:Pyridoxal phosphate-dependent transferase n=1 Tax=Aspergillus novoparasiticus TaxID=986946 RepID=A0A5N6ETQ2_9EURO|nr:pyridoxal phosphate-dependent transferase [Aspergillus novoparasiticus]
MLSSRGTKKAELPKIPWRYAPPHTYNKESNPAGLISFGMAEHVIFTEDSVGYGSSSTTPNRLPNAVASHLNNILTPLSPVEPETVIVASGITAIGSMLSFTLAEPTDGILVSRPVYGRFELDYGVEADVQIVYADTDPEEAFTPAVVDKYEAALKRADDEGTKIRAVLIVNPHNPVDSISSATKYTHPVSLTRETRVLSLSLRFYLSDFAAGGLHLGFLITQNTALRQACKAILRLHNASTASITIGATILEDQDFITQFTQKSRQSLASTYRIATSILTQEGINYVKGGNAGFFIYINLSSYLPYPDRPAQEREFALAQRFLDAGVFLHPGEEHGKEGGWFRLVFAHEEEVLREGLWRVCEGFTDAEGF